MAKDDVAGVALPAPDISTWRRGNADVDYVHVLDSGRPGPEALINAIVHGNELCGAIAVDALLRAGFRPTRGRLTLCFANPDAYRRFDPATPTRSRFVDEDMNRLWTADRLDGAATSRSEEHTSELQSLMRRSYAVLCWRKQKQQKITHTN